MFYDVIQLGGFSLKHCNFNKLAVKIGALISCFTIAMNTMPIWVSAATCNINESNCVCGACDLSPIQWNQSAKGDPHNANWSNFVMGTETIGYSGCFATSVAIEMGMSGDFGKMCPLSLFTWGHENGLWSGNGLVPSAIANIPKYPNIFKSLAVSDEMVQGLGANVSGEKTLANSREELYKIGVQLAKKGAYVILELDYKYGGSSQEHFIPVVGTTDGGSCPDGSLVIADPATEEDDECGAIFCMDDKEVGNRESKQGENEKLKIAYTHTKQQANIPYKAANIISLRVFTSATKFSGKVNATNTDSKDEKEQSANFNYAGIVDFMAESYFIDESALEEAALTLPTWSEFLGNEGYDDAAEVRNWSDSINNSHEEKAHRYIKVSIMFLGILVTLYSILLFIAYQFDKINNFIEFDALGILTFHRLGVSPDGERSTYMDKDTSGTKFLTFRDICIVCVTGVALGVLMISGKIFIIGTAILEFVKKIFMKGGFFR